MNINENVQKYRRGLSQGDCDSLDSSDEDTIKRCWFLKFWRANGR